MPATRVHTATRDVCANARRAGDSWTYLLPDLFAGVVVVGEGVAGVRVLVQDVRVRDLLRGNYTIYFWEVC